MNRLTVILIFLFICHLFCALQFGKVVYFYTARVEVLFLLMRKKETFLIIIFCASLFQIRAQTDTTYIETSSKMWFVSELDHSVIMMDEEGNQFDHYDNYIVVDFNDKKLKVPYASNFIFWDEYDEKMNVKKKEYRLILWKLNKESTITYKLYRVYDKNKLIYDATRKNPFIDR